MSEPGDGAQSTVPMAEAELANVLRRGDALASGTVLAERYQLTRFIARGGMGAVYEAFDRELGVAVALKTIRIDLAWIPSVTERFKREIQLARAVNHPGVCRIFDLGRHGAGDAAVLFLTMELLDGETLAERLRTHGPMAPAEALASVEEIAEALAAAHAAGIVHRDLKPANVMLARRRDRRRPVVTDFGLARHVAGASEDPATAGTDLTSHSGTPGYMAPEQVAGHDVKPAVDVYALGVLAIELLTGKLPPVATVDDVALPPGWAELINRCLAPRPADRFLDAAAVCAAIAGLRARRRRRRAGLAAGIAIALLAAAAAAVIAWRPDAASPADPGLPRDAAAARSWRVGVAAQRNGEETVAIAAFREVIAREPAFALAHAELAGALRGVGDHTNARVAALAASERSGALPREYALIVETRLREIGDEWSRAIELYEELRRIAPAETEYLIRLTYAQVAGGKLADAEVSLVALRDAGVDHPRVMLHEGYLATLQGDYPRLLDACRRAATAAEALGAPRLTALAWDEQGRGHMYLGDHAAAEAAFVEAARRFEAIEDPAGLARVIGHQGQLAAVRGDRAEGRRLIERSLELYRSIGHRDGTGVALVALAMYQPPDQLARALELYQEALAYTGAEDDIGKMNIQFNAATIHYKLGDHGHAREALELVRVVARAHDDSSTLASAAVNLGAITLVEADPPRAQLFFEEARAVGRGLGDPTLNAYVDWGLGEVAAARGDRDGARRALEAAVAAADTVLDPSPVEQARCSLAVLAAREVVTTCTAAGEALARNDLVDEAVLTSWRVIRVHLAARDGAAARTELARLHARADVSNDLHTAVIVRIVDAEVAGDAAAAATLATLADEAAAMGAVGHGFEARFARGVMLRRLGRTRDGNGALTALAADATRRGMLELAQRCAAAQR